MIKIRNYNLNNNTNEFTISHPYASYSTLSVRKTKNQHMNQVKKITRTKMVLVGSKGFESIEKDKDNNFSKSLDLLKGSDLAKTLLITEMFRGL
jgi:hypothetical protein